MKTILLEDLVRIAQSAHYDEPRKKMFKTEARMFLRNVAQELGLEKGQYDNRFNAGGIAVSGDAILHTEDFYLHINDFGVYWRKCKGRKDYTGEYNRQFRNLICGPRTAAHEIAAAFGKE